MDVFPAPARPVSNSPDTTRNYDICISVLFMICINYYENDGGAGKKAEVISLTSMNDILHCMNRKGPQTES